MRHNPFDNLVGGFSTNDGTIDFYLRINSLIKSTDIVLDLGAGRAAWYEDDKCGIRKDIRLLKGKVSKLVAADVDVAVFENRASDEQIFIKDGIIELERESVDLIVADYVLEHIEDPVNFVTQINNVLKYGGWFCARTPHKFSYVSIIASIIKNANHSKILSRVQPGRKEIDIFPTVYKLNTMKDVNKYFSGWNNKSFIHRVDPAYFFGNKIVFQIQNAFHHVIFKEFCGNICVFVQKIH